MGKGSGDRRKKGTGKKPAAAYRGRGAREGTEEPSSRRKVCGGVAFEVT